MAKQIIRLANAVAAIIDADPVCKGKFNSDRTIKQYAEEIWHAKACSIKL